jgi:hypothetical protein
LQDPPSPVKVRRLCSPLPKLELTFQRPS